MRMDWKTNRKIHVVNCWWPMVSGMNLKTTKAKSTSVLLEFFLLRISCCCYLRIPNKVIVEVFISSSESSRYIVEMFRNIYTTGY
jgi:hypothetical protein